MKKTEVIAILLVLSLVISLINAQEEVNIEFPDPECDPQNYNNKYTFNEVCDYVYIGDSHFENIEDSGYLILKDNKVVEADFIAKENSSYKFLINNELKTIDVDKGTKLVYKDGRLEVYGNVNNFEVSEGNKVSLFNIESLEKPIVLEEDKVKGKFKFRDIKVDGVLKISDGKYILEEGTAEFEDVRDVDGFVLKYDTKIKNDFGVISYPSKVEITLEPDGIVMSVFLLDPESEYLNLFYGDDKGFKGNKLVFSHGVNPYSEIGEEILMLDSSEGSFVFDRTGSKMKIVHGELSGASIPDFYYKSDRDRGNLIVDLKNVRLYSSEGKGSIFINKEGKIGPITVYLDNNIEDTRWIPDKIRDKKGINLINKVTNPKMISSLMNMGLDINKAYDVDLYAEGEITYVNIEGVSLKDKIKGDRILLVNLNLKGSAEAASTAVSVITFGRYNPVKKAAKDIRDKIYDNLIYNEIPKDDADKISKMIEEGIKETKGNFWLILNEDEGRLIIKTSKLDLMEIEKEIFEGDYMDKIREALLQ